MSRGAALQRQIAPVSTRAAASVNRLTESGFESAAPGPARFAASLAALPATPVVQRKCGACEAEEETVRARPLGPAPEPSGAGLEVGPAGDHYEREADAIAAQTLAMPANDVVATGDDPSVRRKCAACSEENEGVRADRDGGAAAGSDSRLGASENQLTSGGRPLPDATRTFFEDRMGRDLSSVRVHDGGESARLNGSIAARAFTYGSHIWLGRGERPDTGFTMAHELAHVLQQSQPGEARARRRPSVTASDAGRAVQRKDLRAFWLPDKAGSALGLHTAIHDAAVDAMGAENGGLIQEAPIPNATRKGQTFSSHGWADLFQAKTSIGMKRTCKTPTPGNNCLDDFLVTAGTRGYRGSKKGGASFDPNLAGNRGPVIDTLTGDIDLTDAPKRIQIGDMKPGHNTKEAEKGVDQIDEYATSINTLVDLVNTHQAASKKNSRWAPVSVTPLQNSKIPDGWNPRKNQNKGIWDIKLRWQGKDYPHSLAATPNRRIPLKGRWVLNKHPRHSGVWVYFMRPDNDSLKSLFGRKAESKDIKKIGKLLQQNVLKPLTTPPKKKVKKRPLPAGVAATPVRAEQAPPVVRRKVGKAGVVAPPPKDPFDFKAWELARVGPPGGPAGTSFKGEFEKAIPEADQETVLMKGGAIQATEALEAAYGSMSLEKPVGGAGMVSEAKEVREFQFWAGPKASFLGRLRDIFGGLFVKVFTVAQQIKAKIAERLDSFNFKGKSTGLQAVAIKVGSAIVKYIGGVVATRTAAALTDCLSIGLQNKFEKLTKGTVIEELEEKAEEIKAFVEKTKDELLADATAFANEIAGPLIAKFKELEDDIKVVASVVGFVKKAMNALRLGGCIAGGLETIGVACILALADFGLSLVDLSPTEAIAGLLMDNCVAKSIVSEGLMGLKFFHDLPRIIARAIVEKVKPLLPDWAQDILCDVDKDLKVEPMTKAQFNCDDMDKGGDGTLEPETPESPPPQQQESGGAGDAQKQPPSPPPPSSGADGGDGQGAQGKPGDGAPQKAPPPQPGEGPQGKQEEQGQGGEQKEKPKAGQGDQGGKGGGQAQAGSDGGQMSQGGKASRGQPGKQAQPGQGAQGGQGSQGGQPGQQPQPSQAANGSSAARPGDAEPAPKQAKPGKGAAAKGKPKRGKNPKEAAADKPLPPKDDKAPPKPGAAADATPKGEGDQPQPAQPQPKPAPGPKGAQGTVGVTGVPAPDAKAAPQPQPKPEPGQEGAEPPAEGPGREEPKPDQPQGEGQEAGGADSPAPKDGDRPDDKNKDAADGKKAQDAKKPPEPKKTKDKTGKGKDKRPENAKPDGDKGQADKSQGETGDKQPDKGEEERETRIPEAALSDAPGSIDPNRRRNWRLIIESGLPTAQKIQATDPRECWETTIHAQVWLDSPDQTFKITTQAVFCYAQGSDDGGPRKYWYHFRTDLHLPEHDVMIRARPGDDTFYIYNDINIAP